MPHRRNQYTSNCGESPKATSFLADMPSPAVAPPDGGYGYLVMATSWAAQFLVGTIWVGYATLMVDLSEHFQTSQATVAITGALFTGTMNICSLLTGGLIHQFGSKPVCMIGAVITSGAAVSTAYATNVYQTYFTFGVLGGLGSSAILLPSIVILQQYFDSKRAVTTGIASTGLSTGALVVGPLYRLLIDQFGWRMTLVAHGGMILQGAVIGATFRPLSVPKKQEQEHMISKDSNTKRPCCKNVFSQIVDWKLFHNKCFLLFILGALLWQYGVATMYNLGPSRAVSQGMEKFWASLLPSTIAICSLVSRFVNSLIANTKCANVVLQSGALCVASGVVICLSCVTTSFYGSAIFGGVYGFCMGGFGALFPTVCVGLVGIENASRALGLVMTSMCVTGLIAMPIGGWVFDKTSDYNISFLMSGIIATVGGLCVCATLLLKSRVNKGGAPENLPKRPERVRDKEMGALSGSGMLMMS